jgi:hypothetical protein
MHLRTQTTTCTSGGGGGQQQQRTQKERVTNVWETYVPKGIAAVEH